MTGLGTRDVSENAETSRSKIVDISSRLAPTAAAAAGSARRAPKEQVVQRRASLRQGQALEVLGHAVEYLADSRLFLPEEDARASRTNQDAMAILMRMSRDVFSECQEVVTIWARVGRAMDRIFRPAD